MQRRIQISFSVDEADYRTVLARAEANRRGLAGEMRVSLEEYFALKNAA
jgi:hypothetical protein